MRISKAPIMFLAITLAASLALPVFPEDGAAPYKANAPAAMAPQAKIKVGPALKGTSLT